MRRLGLVTLVTVLALPGAALAHPRTFSARVVSASAHALTVRLNAGKLVRYAPAHVAPARPEQPLLAHAARAAQPGGATFALETLEPGVTVLVSATSAGVTVALPGPGAPEQRASGVVSDVGPDGFVLSLPDGTRLRLHTARRASLRRCESASVTYHQDVALLVADGVHRRAGGPPARGCAARSATGTITAIGPRTVTIATASGRPTTFRVSRAVREGCAAGDVVDVTYARGRAISLAYVEWLVHGTVSGVGDGSVTIIDGATGRSRRFATEVALAAGEHVGIVYHRSGGRAVADAVYG